MLNCLEVEAHQILVISSQLLNLKHINMISNNQNQMLIRLVFLMLIAQLKQILPKSKMKLKLNILIKQLQKMLDQHLKMEKSQQINLQQYKMSLLQVGQLLLLIKMDQQTLLQFQVLHVQTQHQQYLSRTQIQLQIKKIFISTMERKLIQILHLMMIQEKFNQLPLKEVEILR